MNITQSPPNIFVPQEREGGWIYTYTGRKFWPLDPRPEDICIEDVAHALSNQCRFTGHVIHFYSIAQHCVYVSDLCEYLKDGLLHDGSEAYICDVARPIKHLIPMYKQFEAKLEQCLSERFGVSYPIPSEVKEVDTKMLNTEARDLLKPGYQEAGWTIDVEPYFFKIEPLNPKESEELYLSRYYELFN